MSGLEPRRPLRDARQKDWFWVSNSIFDVGLSKHALAVYVYLCRRAGDSGSCFPSINRISQDTGWSRSSVKQALDELELAALLQRETRIGEDGEHGSNRYTIFNPQVTRSTGDHPRRYKLGSPRR